MARFPCQITHSAISVRTNDGPAVLLYCNHTTHAIHRPRNAGTQFRCADSGGSRPRIRDDVAQHSDLMSLGVPR
jgi:hypothetical protein